MKDAEQSVRRRTYELSLPTIMRADNLAVVSGAGKSELMEASIGWFMMLVKAYASCAGVTQSRAARELVRAIREADGDPSSPGFAGGGTAEALLG